MYDPNEEWNVQPCQMTRIHLRHPHIACAFFISYLYANEILCDFPSSGVIFIILLTIHAHSRVGVSPPKMGDTHFRTPVPADLPSFTDDDERKKQSRVTRTKSPHPHTPSTQAHRHYDTFPSKYEPENCGEFRTRHDRHFLLVYHFVYIMLL